MRAIPVRIRGHSASVESDAQREDPRPLPAAGEAFDEVVRTVAVLAVIGGSTLLVHEIIVHTNQAYPTVYVGNIYLLEEVLPIVRWTFYVLAGAAVVGCIRRLRRIPKS